MPRTAKKATKKATRAPAKKAEAKPKGRIITPNRLQLERLIIIVEGVGKGYLSNKFPDDTMEQIAAKQAGTGGAKANKIRDFHKDFEQSLRVDEEGRCCMPGAAFKNAIVRAAKPTGIPMTDVKGMFQILDELLPIENSKPMMHRRAVKKGRVACCACFPNMPRRPWQVRLPITFDSAQTSPEVLVDLVNRAGFFVGVGAWRPEKNGSMGMFRVKALA